MDGMGVDRWMVCDVKCLVNEKLVQWGYFLLFSLYPADTSLVRLHAVGGIRDETKNEQKKEKAISKKRKSGKGVSWRGRHVGH